MTTTFHAQDANGIAAASGFTPFQFPGGEWHLRIDSESTVEETHATVIGATADDLVLLGLWADAMHQRGHRAVAHLPYLPAARADRGTPFGAKVYASLLNAAELDEVVIFDPHSPVAPELVNNIRIVHSTEIVVQQVIPALSGYGKLAGIIAPDHGAADRAGRVAEQSGLPLFIADKHRDFDTGKITGMSVPELPADGLLLVVDDICDGGGTFIGLAQQSGIGRDRLALWVSHGIFSGNAVRLHDHYGHVWTSDSHTGTASTAGGRAHIVELAPHLAAVRNAS